jgi:hypothetical protein
MHTFRAGDLVKHATTGEQCAVAYARGDEVSLHAVEPEAEFLGRWRANLDANWPDDAGPKPKTYRGPRLRGPDGIPLGQKWPVRRWTAPTQSAPTLQLTDGATANDDAPPETLPEAGLDTCEAPEEVIVHAADLVLVRAASDAKHAAVLAHYATQPAPRVPCSACAARAADGHPAPTSSVRKVCPGCDGARVVQGRVCGRCKEAGWVHEVKPASCHACADTGSELLDRRPDVCREQLAAHEDKMRAADAYALAQASAEEQERLLPLPGDIDVVDITDIAPAQVAE